ncbi:MAG: sigma 54-interacting transcriptional regulator [Deltaproteobacteria bacterium]|nr:sigma 54-interacting transcriptional regulator [Deltaproteobacteria bacterium]
MLNLLECSPIAQFALGRDHRVISWNRACELLTGYSAGEMIGTDHHWKPFYARKRPLIADLMVENDFPLFQELYSASDGAVSQTVRNAWEANHFFPDLGGKPRHVHFIAAPILDDGRLIGAIESFQDITQQKRFEEEILHSRMRYRILTEHVADGVALIQAGKFLFVNGPLVSMLGYRRQDELVGREPASLVPEQFREGFQEMLQGLESGDTGERILQWPFTTGDRGEVWVEAHQSLTNWEGRAAVLMTMRDVTERRLRDIAARQEAEHVREENLRLRSTIKERYRFGNIIGKSPAMQEVYELILKAAAADASVIVYGESGTGKELVAQAVHDASRRRDQPFVPVNCGAIPEPLLESEFFGHKKGAFTGAHMDKHGYFDLADGGTLFLDEVGELSANIQVKLLRAIERGEYRAVGGNELKRSDFRIIAATHRNLPERISQGSMREDFFYRIHIIPIHVPPLRDRREDIPLLIDHFLQVHGNGGTAPRIPGNVLEHFYRHDWPGNVRELQNVIHRYLTVKRLDFTGVATSGPSLSPPTDPAGIEGGQTDLRDAVENFEKTLIVRTLERNRWHKSRAADLLGISRRTLFRKLKYFELA